MFRKVVVGVATRAGDQEAIALARALAPSAELVLVNAYPFDNVPSRFALLAYGNALRADAKHALENVREAAGIPDAGIDLVPDTSPARALHRVASRRHADLLVIASSRRGHLQRILLGDVARDVLHGAPCPVAVAPHGSTGAAIGTIGVAFDGSPESRLALELAAAIAADLGARLRVLHVVTGPAAPASIRAYSVDLLAVDEKLKAEAQARLDEALAQLDPAIDAAGEAVAGVPSKRLPQLTEDADVVLTGSRGWGTLRSVVLGSTSDRLIHHAQCPVIVVPRGVSEGEGRLRAGPTARRAPTPAR